MEHYVSAKAAIAFVHQVIRLSIKRALAYVKRRLSAVFRVCVCVGVCTFACVCSNFLFYSIYTYLLLATTFINHVNTSPFFFCCTQSLHTD